VKTFASGGFRFTYLNSITRAKKGSGSSFERPLLFACGAQCPPGAHGRCASRLRFSQGLL